MRIVFTILLLCYAIFHSTAQPAFNSGELKRTVDPYSISLPENFQHFELNSFIRNDDFKVSYELFEYFDQPTQAWKPAFKFEHTYLPDSKPDIQNEYSFDLIISDWINSARLTFSYDAFGYQSEIKEETYDAMSAGLINYALFEQEHDVTGNLLLEQTSYWNPLNVNWDLNHKHDFTYNTSNDETSVIHADWDLTDSQWKPYEEYFSSYDINENLIQYLGLAWDIDSLKWLKFAMDTMIYDLNNQRIQDESLIWSASKSEWEKFLGRDYEYDISGNLTRITTMFWDSAGNQFKNTSQYLYEFTSGQLASVTFQVWNGSWTDFNKTDYIYDINNFLIEKIIFTSSGGNWQESYHYVYTNDANGNVLMSLGQSWNPGNSSWNDVERYTAEWVSFVTGLLSNPISRVSIYPNPATHVLHITGLEKSLDGTIEISGISGEPMSYFPITLETIDINGLSNGMYLLKAKNQGKTTVIKKFVIAR